MSEFDAKKSLVVGVAPESLEDLSWLNETIEKHIKQRPQSVVLDEHAGGISPTTKFLKVTLQDGSIRTFVFKTTLGRTLEASRLMGLPRESFCYAKFAPTLKKAGVTIPEVLYAYGNLETGEKSLLLEDLSVGCIQAGYLFGPGSPINWGKDLNEIIAKSNPNQVQHTLREVVLKTYIAAAKLHATYWMDKSLLKHEFLRSVKWYEGEGHDSWVDAHRSASDEWARTKEKIAAGTSKVQWNSHLVACMDASFAKISWEAYNEARQDPTRQWTLVHGDFHPANTMWRWGKDGTESSVILLDWEMVGLGSGPQDLAQYLISHATPEVRREIEEPLVREYYACLTGSALHYWTDSAEAHRHLVDSDRYTWEMCWRDYVEGGTLRWVWMLGFLGRYPDEVNQFFQDQMSAFILDHGVTPENIGMPRI